MRAPFALWRPVAYGFAALGRSLRRSPLGWSLAISGIGMAGIALPLVFTLQRPPAQSAQLGYRGLGMVEHWNPRDDRAVLALNTMRAPLPPAIPSGKRAGDVFHNVQVLQDLDSNEFLRLMASMTAWVAPQVGCAYCHSTTNMADDTVYTKIVARRMILMTRAINTQWKIHVGDTGVTCETCHRGQGVPAGVWTVAPSPGGAHSMAQTTSGRGHPSRAAGETSLPYDPFAPFLSGAAPIRVEETTPLPPGPRTSIAQTEWTYALMMHFSESLGVNCVFCHNSRDFRDWAQSTPNRIVAWEGIRMVRDLNNTTMHDLAAVFPAQAHGPFGDGPKLSCVTCHNGAYKPFYGASDVSAYPELAGAPPTTIGDAR